MTPVPPFIPQALTIVPYTRESIDGSKKVQAVDRLKASIHMRLPRERLHRFAVDGDLTDRKDD